MMLKLHVCWETSCSFIKAVLPVSKLLTRALKNNSGRSFPVSLWEFSVQNHFVMFLPISQICLTPFLKFMPNQRSFESCFFQWHLWLPSMVCVKKPRSVLHYFSSLIGLPMFLLKSGGKLDFSGIKWILISVYAPDSYDIFHNLLVINKLLVHALLKDEWKKTKFKV